jgi:hypothetical protein
LLSGAGNVELERQNDKIFLAFDFAFCYYVLAVHSAKHKQGGASAWQNVSFATRTLRSESK